jgi:hypothetical protein
LRSRSFSLFPNISESVAFRLRSFPAAMAVIRIKPDWTAHIQERHGDEGHLFLFGFQTTLINLPCVKCGNKRQTLIVQTASRKESEGNNRSVTGSKSPVLAKDDGEIAIGMARISVESFDFPCS